MKAKKNFEQDVRAITNSFIIRDMKRSQIESYVNSTTFEIEIKEEAKKRLYEIIEN